MKLIKLLSLILALLVGAVHASSYLYVSGNSPRGETTLIELNPSTGELIGSPLFVGEDSFFHGASDFAINNGYFYATNAGGVAKCVLMPDKSIRNCVYTGNGFSYPAAIKFNAVSSNHTLYAYIANKPYKKVKSSVSKCAVNTTNGELVNCALTGALFDTPISIAFYNDSYAYITNAEGEKSIIRCKASSSGELVNCEVMKNTGITQPRSIAISDNHAYIADGEQNSISLCIINSKAGVFENCKPTGSGFVYPTATLIYHERLYVTNLNDDTLSSCQIQNGDGLLSDCVKSSYYFNSPYRMVVYETP